MSIDLSNKTAQELDNLLTNYRRKGRTQDPVFLEILRLRELKNKNKLEFDRSLEIVMAAARDKKFVAYKALAVASGAEWSKVHWEMSNHLQQMLEYTFAKGWPPLSAIVVNAENVRTGEMKESARIGFLKGARDAGYSAGGDTDDDIRKIQASVFEWAEQAVNT